MKRWLHIIEEDPLQFLVYAAIFGVVILATAVVRGWERGIFVSRLGAVNPLISIPILSLVGLACFLIVIERDWFSIFRSLDGKGYALAAILSVLFCIEAIVLDWVFRYPRDMNILFPKSLLYYPVVGFVVNILFHVVLVTVLASLLRLIAPRMSTDTLLWIAIVIAAILEPVYQMAAGATAGGWSWFMALTGVHVLLINLGQLYIWKRYDFATMYGMRLMYYLLWHIIWGMARLPLFFI